MAEASRLNLSVSAGGSRDRPKAKAQNHRLRPPTLEEVKNWIRSLSLSPEIEKELIKKANKYPLDAMYRFREKISQHIAEIQRNLQAGNSINENEN